MPLAVSFVAACARGLGLGNGEAPLAPSITAPANVVRTVTAVSGNGTTVTYTTSAPHGFTAGQLVTVVGITTTTAYNGSFIIAATPSTTTFTVTASTTGVGTISGDETATCNPVLGTAITAAISYTITISTFPLARVEYKLDKTNASNSVTDAGQWTGSLPGASGSNSATLSTRVNSSGSSENLLHAQKYALYLRAVDGAGQTGPESTVGRFTTATEVAPTAATPSITSSQVSYPTAPFLQFSWGAGTDGTHPIGTRKYAVVAGTNPGAPLEASFTTLSGSSGTTTVTTTYDGTALLPGTGYTVYLRYAASSPGSASNTAYATHTTAAEILPSAPSVSVSLPADTNAGRTQIIISRTNVPEPPIPTYLYKYQYAYGTSVNPTNWEDFPSSGTASSITITGLPNDTTYYARVRAKSLVTNNGGEASNNATIQTNPAFPDTPQLDWNGMSGYSYGTANFTITNTGGSTVATYLVERIIDGSNYNAIWRTGTSISGYESDGGTRWYVAENRNRINEIATSNQLKWTRPKKNQPWSLTGTTFGQSEYHPNFTYVIPTNTCQPYRLGLRTGNWGVPDDSNAPGYIIINYMVAIFKCGLQLTRPSDSQNFKKTDGSNLTSLCNTSNLRFSYATANSESSSNDAIPVYSDGSSVTTRNFSSDERYVYRFIYLGGSAVNNKTFWAQSTTGKGWLSGCVLSLTGDYYSGKLFELHGFQTTQGSFT